MVEIFHCGRGLTGLNVLEVKDGESCLIFNGLRSQLGRVLRCQGFFNVGSPLEVLTLLFQGLREQELWPKKPSPMDFTDEGLRKTRTFAEYR